MVGGASTQQVVLVWLRNQSKQDRRAGQQTAPLCGVYSSVEVSLPIDKVTKSHQHNDVVALCSAL